MIDKLKTEGLLAHLPPLRRRQFLAGAAATAAAAALGGHRAALAAGGKTLRIAAYSNPSSLDPALGGSGGDHPYLYNFYDTLIDFEFDTLEPRPGLAKTWTFTDPKTLVLTLQEGVTFHDGAPFDAKAVAFNLERNRTAEKSNLKPDLSSVESTEATGELEVTIHLKQPDTALPLILSDRAGMIVSPKALGDDPESDAANRNPVGTGPWKFVSWTDQDVVKGARFDGHWRPGVPVVDDIEMKIIPERATALRAVQSGQADAAYTLSESQKTLIERLPGIKLVQGPTVYTFNMYFNASRGPLADKRVRQAFNMAIDRDAFVQATMAGIGEPAYMLLPKAHWAYAPDVEQYCRYDPDRSKALLKEAGFEGGVELDFVGYTDQAYIQRQEVVLSFLGKVGIRGTFRNGTIPDITSRFMGKEKSGDIMMAAWTGRPDPTQTYDLVFRETSFYNPGRTPTPEGFVEALAASRASSDQAERAKALATVQKIVMEAALNCPLAVRYEVDAITDKVGNFKPNLLGKPKFRDVTLA